MNQLFVLIHNLVKVALCYGSMYGYHLPKGLQVDFAKVIQDISEEEGGRSFTRKSLRYIY